MDVDRNEDHGGQPLGSLLNEHLSEALRCASIGTWGWDIRADQLTWSIFQTSEHDVRLRVDVGALSTFLRAAVSDDQAGLAAALEAGRLSGAEIHHTFRYVGSDGQVGRVALDAAPIRDSEGTTAFVGVTRDVTTQTLLVERLTESFAIRDRVARALEISLLPPTLPALPGFSVDADFRSTEGTSTGDFYDLFPLGGQDWGLTIGDVGGHGTDAAAITTAIRYTLRAAAQVRKSAVKVMTAGNEAHFAAVRDERFTTAHYVRIRPNAGGFELGIVTAGHPELFVRRSNGSVEAVAGSGPMLGLMEEAEFAVARTLLKPGDMIVACTDGAIEARRDGVLFGRDGIDAFLRQWDGPVTGCAAALHDAAEAFSGGPVGDDMATVVLRVDDANDARQ